jgi:hypothetical protein
MRAEDLEVGMKVVVKTGWYNQLGVVVDIGNWKPRKRHPIVGGPYREYVGDGKTGYVAVAIKESFGPITPKTAWSKTLVRLNMVLKTWEQHLEDNKEVFERNKAREQARKEREEKNKALYNDIALVFAEYGLPKPGHTSLTAEEPLQVIADAKTLRTLLNELV